MDGKKKVCVISAYAYIVKHINYGSLLQYYALEKKLEEMGYSSYWLRFVLPEEKREQSIKGKIKAIILKKRQKSIDTILKSFQEFILQYLHISEKLYTEEKLKSDCPQADIYLTGSDQVWGGVLEPNYLTFAPMEKQKISYAASFGKSAITDEHLYKIKPWLKKLNAISVREPSGVEICKKAKVKAELVIDPTLLILGEDYPIQLNKAAAYENYYFGYFLNVMKQNADEYISFLSEAEKKLGKIICVAGVSQLDRYLAKGQYDYFTPEEWLGMYKESQGIITNTFHGTVFAIIFKKNFLVYLQGGSTAKQNERIYSLLKTYKLEDRLIHNLDSIEKQMKKKIDWDHVDSIIRIKREKALEYLKKSLEGK